MTPEQVRINSPEYWAGLADVVGNDPNRLARNAEFVAYSAYYFHMEGDQHTALTLGGLGQAYGDLLEGWDA